MLEGFQPTVHLIFCYHSLPQKYTRDQPHAHITESNNNIAFYAFSPRTKHCHRTEGFQKITAINVKPLETFYTHSTLRYEKHSLSVSMLSHSLVAIRSWFYKVKTFYYGPQIETDIHTLHKALYYPLL